MEVGQEDALEDLHKVEMSQVRKENMEAVSKKGCRAEEAAEEGKNMKKTLQISLRDRRRNKAADMRKKIRDYFEDDSI